MAEPALRAWCWAASPARSWPSRRSRCWSRAEARSGEHARPGGAQPAKELVPAVGVLRVQAAARIQHRLELPAAHLLRLEPRARPLAHHPGRRAPRAPGFGGAREVRAV